MEINEKLALELGLTRKRVDAAVELLDAGNTVPFVARYRKEVTGSMGDVTLRKLLDRLTYLRGLEKKREEIRSLIDAQGKLDEETSGAISKAETVTELDDIYRPFRPKRKTRASVAREKGLEPLADELFAQKRKYAGDIAEIACEYTNEEKGVLTVDEALRGAMDIIAENISDNADYRRMIREATRKYGVLVSKKLADNDVFEQYYEYSEPLAKIPPHRILALNRGEKEGVLSISVEADEKTVLDQVLAMIIKDKNSPAVNYVSEAAHDSYARLIAPSVERELRGELTDAASESAISLFSMNLRGLLMQPPLKGKTVLGFDPGYRTGCKLAVVTKTGAVAETDVIYPTKPHERIAEAEKTVARLIEKYSIDVVAIGNGTASGEGEMFISNLISKLGVKTKYIIVSEAGASVYSASEAGAEEFPDFDVTERSAVSIARRLQDPMAELVKIDPKSIGVGQYQHDMKSARLDEALTGVVEDCVNSVGVDVNTASYSLLSYIAGINKTSAKNIVKYREENGEFSSRREILKVPRFGAKAFEQAAGFLRIPGAKEPLDNTGVHPESYKAAAALLAKFGRGESGIGTGLDIDGDVKKYGVKRLAAELDVGEETLSDIVAELKKPGRDIRDSFTPPPLKEKVMTLEDLTEGMLLTGTVRNVTDFGAFVDIGVHQDGLLHISEIADRFIRHPSEELSVGDVIEVAVKSVDTRRKRIALTRRGIGKGKRF